MSDQEIMQLHATCVAIAGRGVLLRGPSGSGKSDLSLRLIDQPGFGFGDAQLHSRLVGDDQIIIKRRADALIVSPAARLAGFLEIRGIGIMNCPHDDEAHLALVVDLALEETIERLPDAGAQTFEALGITVPRIEVDAHWPSAAARVRAGLLADQTR